MRERYEEYIEQKREEQEYHELYKDDVYYEEQGETQCNCCNNTTSGVPLNRLVTVTTIPDYDGGFSAVNWDPTTNQFLVCKPGVKDFPIYRTEETLRSLAQMIAFNPKEWGCPTCGCSTIFKDYEYVCWCDSCKDGCDSPAKVMPLPRAEPRKRSVFLSNRRGSLPPPPPPPTGKLERLTAVGSSDTLFEPTPVSPKSTSSKCTSPHYLSAEDTVKFKFA